MKSKVEVEKEGQSTSCGIHFVEFGRTAGLRLIATPTARACISKSVSSQLGGAGTFIFNVKTLPTQ